MDVGVVDSVELDSGGLEAGGDEAGEVDPGGVGTDEEIEVSVLGMVLGVVGGPFGGDETGQTVVEIAIVEVTTIVE